MTTTISDIRTKAGLQFWGLTYCGAASLGCLLYLLVRHCPHRVLQLFAPANDSIWEGLKLFYWPMVVAGFSLSWSSEHQQHIWGGVFAAQLAMPAAFLLLYYPLAAGFEMTAFWLRVVLYLLVMAAGFVLMALLQRTDRVHRHAGRLAMLSGLWGVLLILFTIAAPDLPVFQG